MKFINNPFRGPIVVGVSGGADSVALLFLLQEAGVEAIVAHVNHGLRAESGTEEGYVRELAEREGFPFFCKRLALSPSGNLEERLREERLAFFREVVRETGADAVALAHHRKDQAETVLKRVCEGGWFQGGMKEIGENRGLILWRPLLQVKKEELVSYLQGRSIRWFEDQTNHTDAFLRGRMRNSLFPELERCLGKGVEGPLSRMGEEVGRMVDYLDHENRPLLARRSACAVGWCSDWSDLDLHPVRWWHLVKESCPDLSHAEVELALGALGEKKANVKVGRYTIDRGILYSLETEEVEWVASDLGEREGGCSNWEELFKGRVFVSHIEGLELGRPDPAALYGGKALQKWWSEHKVPSGLRNLFPVLYQGKEMVHEFLTGEVHPRFREAKKPFFYCFDLRARDNTR